MKIVPVVRHKNPVFISESNKQLQHISLVSDPKEIPIGSRYVVFDQERFAVFKRSDTYDRFVRSFSNLSSAVFCVRKK